MRAVRRRKRKGRGEKWVDLWEALPMMGSMKSMPSGLYHGPTEPLLQRTESTTILDVNEKL